MATYEPPLDLFQRQLDSIRAQTHRDWVCVISDDCSRPERFAAIQADVAATRASCVSRSRRRLGFYRNFERALRSRRPRRTHVALADQDDAWHPEKLATLLAEIGDAQLVYSDARIVDRDGELVAEHLLGAPAQQPHRPALAAGGQRRDRRRVAASARDLLDDALPFPPAQFAHFHDHWLALVRARARRDPPSSTGRSTTTSSTRTRRSGTRRRTACRGCGSGSAALRRDPRERVRLWRMHYFVDACRLMQFATVLRAALRRPDDRDASARRSSGCSRADRSLPRARAALGAGRARARRAARDARRGVDALARASPGAGCSPSTRPDRPTRRLRLDAVAAARRSPPRPGRAAGPTPGREALAEKIAPLRARGARRRARAASTCSFPRSTWSTSSAATSRSSTLRGGWPSAGVRVRIVTVDPVGPLPRSWQAGPRVLQRARRALRPGRGRVRPRVAGTRGQPRRRVRGDDLVDGAHRARRAAALDRDRFLYLIQEYEPFTFPMGSYAALARGVLPLPARRAVLDGAAARLLPPPRGSASTRDGAAAGDAASAAFENAITAVEPPGADELARRETRRLLFYARPEPHAARNMFELGVLALRRALDAGRVRGRLVAPRRSGRSMAAGAWTSAAAPRCGCCRARLSATTRGFCAITTSALH